MQNAEMYGFADMTVKLVNFFPYCKMLFFYFECTFSAHLHEIAKFFIFYRKDASSLLLTPHSLVMRLHTLCMTSADLQRETEMVYIIPH
jgi:hypothetical protein